MPSDGVTHTADPSISSETSGRGMAPAVPSIVSPIRSTPNSGTCSPVSGSSAKLSIRGENASGSSRRASSP